MPNSDLEEFKSQHGAQWQQIIETPAFRAAFQLLNIWKINYITSLTDEVIERHSREIIGDLRGHLQHENDLISLHEKDEFKMPSDEPEDYMSPETQAQLEDFAEKLKKQQK